MSNPCQNCKAPTPGVFLCDVCTENLQNALDELPWLLIELETTICRLDKLNQGVQGRSSENPSPVNFGAAALASEVGEILTRWMDVLSKANHLPIYTGTAIQRAKWLSRNVSLVARHDRAGEMYSDVTDLVGDPDKPSKPGRLVRAIDRSIRIYAGTCPTVVGRNQEGTPVECGRDLWSEDGVAEVMCDKCQQPIDVKRNRERVIMDRDLLPERRLTEVMSTLGEPIYSDLIQKWLKTGQLKPSGYLSGTRIVPNRINKTDARLLSLSRVRQLRWAHQEQLSEVAS